MTRIEILAPTPLTAEHEVNGFDCGETVLNEWLQKRAFKNHVSGASRCFVICNNESVIGYYCLSAGAIALISSPKSMRRNMPDPMPILLLGRLAIDQNHHNQGFGKALLRDAMIRAVNVSTNAGIFAILVHALSEQAKRFYISCGFVESPLQAMTLMMTLKTIRDTLAENYNA